MNLLASSQMLSTLEMYLTEITDRQIEREGQKLDKRESGDTDLGPLTSDFAKRLWCAHSVIRSRAVQAMARSKEAVEDYEEKALEREYRRLDDLADICKEWVWHEVRQDIGEKAWAQQGVGLREGWIVVIPKEKQGPDIGKFFRAIGLPPPE